MKAGFKDLLFYPDTFFKNIAQEEVNLIPPVLIVAGGCAIFLSGILVPLGINILHALVSGNPLPLTSLYLVPFVWLLVRCYILWPFLLWILASGLLYLFSRLFSEDGSFPAVLQNAGYGMVPWVISSMVSVVATSILIMRPEYYYTNLLLNPATVNATLFYTFMLWCSCLWVFAVKHTCHITVQRAVGVVVFTVIALFIPLYLAAYFPFSF